MKADVRTRAPQHDRRTLDQKAPREAPREAPRDGDKPERLGSRASMLDCAGIACLGAVMAIHTSELAGKTEEVAYLGFGYMLLAASSLVAVVLLAQRDVRGWWLGGLTCGATIGGFVLTRTTGLPMSHDDIGNWGETVAVWALVAEVAMVAMSVVAVRRERPS
jgi:hypothetical protein